MPQIPHTPPTLPPPTPPPMVRPLRPDDIAPIAAWVSTLPLMQRYGVTAPRMRELLHTALDSGHVVLVADAGQPACGFAWCIPTGAFGRSPYLRLIGVAPAYAGAGVGSALLTTLEARLSQTHPDLFLLVSDFNTQAQRFYVRHGYRQVGAIPGYVVPDVTELLFWKRLGTLTPAE